MVSDLVIKNGLIFDGTGNPPFKANLFINDGKIIKISRDMLSEADKVINAEGLAVAPGFIDIHQHSDHTLFACPKCESFIHQGVTTVSVGHCGLSLAPLSTEYKNDVIRFLEAFTFFPVLKVPYNWLSFGEYLDRLEEVGLGINVYPLVAHGTLKAAVMGYEKRKTTKRELEEMKQLLEQSMKEGACALSTGGTPPTIWSETTELIELARIVAKYGGIYITHLIRGSGLGDGFDEAVEIGKEAAIPVEVAHYTGIGVPEARALGVDVTYDAYPYHAGSGHLGDLIPGWLYDGGVDAMVDKIKSEKVRDKIRADKRWGVGIDWDKAFMAFLPSERSKKYEGRSIGEISKSEKLDPIEFVCGVLIENNGNGMFVYRNSRTEAYVLKTLTDPFQFIMSDGWGFAPYEPLNIGKPHPRCYGAFPRVLGWYVRECELITLQEAIRKMTSGPALKLGITDRGLLRENLWADITVFNPRTVTDRATFENPHQYPIGIEYVILNGKVVIEEGEHTGVRAGKILSINR